ncbi:uncharacterized protein LOC124113781 [Haliotis rufescens]|uniref:uncharacterized protein LOC124113781 n=1 Tax=Haliotis rufescens TaxID=6454 RepID=UPI00201F79F5|nr:uncharacterized protein LOC124113781 [Haliotis rufescens]
MDLQTVSNNVCFDNVDEVRNIKHKQVIVGTTFITFKDLGLLGCVKQCLVREKCQSFNFHFDKTTCELNAINSSTTDAVVSADQGSAYSDIESWPRRVAGSCWNHTCAVNSVCVDYRNDSPYCRVECPDPQTVRNGQILSQRNCHEVGCVIEYNCSVGYVQSREAVCGQDGSWSSFKCVRGCGNPPLVNNAVLDDSENPFPVGRVLNYTCNKPLVGLGKM